MKRFFSLVLCFAAAVFMLPLSSCGEEERRTCYEITATFSGNTVEGNEKVTFYNDTANALTELKFNLFPNAFRSGAKYKPYSESNRYRFYAGEESFGGITVLSVSVDGAAADFNVEGKDENVLTVKLGKEIFPEERTAVEIDFKTTLATCNGRCGINEKCVNLSGFYPVLCVYDDGFYECLYYPVGDPFYCDCADYSVTLFCDDDYAVAGAGKLVKRDLKDGIAQRRYELKNGRSFNFILSKEYQTVSGNADGVAVDYYYYDDENPQKSLGYAIDAIKTFNKLFGEYPYPVFSVAQTRFSEGGMEFPSLVYISDAATGEDYGEIIIHETAHMWWQSVVGNNEIEYPFLDEGLAEFSTALFYGENPVYGKSYRDFIDRAGKTFSLYCSAYQKLYGGANTSMLRAIPEYDGEYEYVNIAYIKPCVMYDTLKTSVGDEKFFSALKNYYENYRFKNATPYDIAAEFSKYCTDAESFFDTFFKGKEII